MRAFSNGCVLSRDVRRLWNGCASASPDRRRTPSRGREARLHHRTCPRFALPLFTPTVDFDQVMQQPAGPPPTPGHTGIKAMAKGLVPAPAQGSAIKENLGRLIRKIGIHGNGSYRHPLDRDVTKGWGYGVSIGLSPGHTNGWKYPFALTFFTQDLHSPNGDEFASIRTRALLGGIGYGWHFGRFSTGVQLQTGYALNHVSLKGDLEHAFNAAMVSVDVGNSWLLRPSVKAEYFLTPKFSVRVSGDYVYMRPRIVVTTPRSDSSGAGTKVTFTRISASRSTRFESKRARANH